jgi:hypothetical protein
MERKPSGPRRLSLAAAALTAALLLPPPAALAADPVLFAAGDIACDPGDPSYNGGLGTATACRMKATSDLLVGSGAPAVLVLGDNQYEEGALAKYQQSYDPTWGRFKALTRPVPGNHDYANGASAAAGYYTYFGAAAGDPSRGYYSYDLGAWHLVALNSNCWAVGGCGAGSPQESWLARDLAAAQGRCILAYWHHPRFSSGAHGDDPTFDAFWRDLVRAGADVVLAGHEHHYERYAPQGAAGNADPGGPRQLVVGSGGRNLTAIVTPRPNSAFRNDTSFGVLEMTLHPDRYDWRFLAAPSGAALDSGTALCHRRTAPRGARFHTVPPCRMADTRNGSPMGAGRTRTFAAAGQCGIPAEARAVVLNVTGILPTTAGYVRLYPAGGVAPVTDVLAFRAGQIRAGATVAGLGQQGQVTALNDSTGEIHLAIDVTGYFVE